MSIAFREGLKVPPAALNEIIMAANQDVRQVRSFMIFPKSCHFLYQIENYILNFFRYMPDCRIGT